MSLVRTKNHGFPTWVKEDNPAVGAQPTEPNKQGSFYNYAWDETGYVPGINNMIMRIDDILRYCQSNGKFTRQAFDFDLFPDISDGITIVRINNKYQVNQITGENIREQSIEDSRIHDDNNYMNRYWLTMGLDPNQAKVDGVLLLIHGGIRIANRSLLKSVRIHVPDDGTPVYTKTGNERFGAGDSLNVLFGGGSYWFYRNNFEITDWEIDTTGNNASLLLFEFEHDTQR